MFNNEYLIISIGIDEVLISTNFFSDVYSTLIVVKLNGIRLSVNVDSITRTHNDKNTPRSHMCPNENDEKSNETSTNKQLKKFVEYVSYLKFLVTFVASNVNFRIDTKDERDPISAASFEATGNLFQLHENIHKLSKSVALKYPLLSRINQSLYFRNQNSS